MQPKQSTSLPNRVPPVFATMLSDLVHENYYPQASPSPRRALSVSHTHARFRPILSKTPNSISPSAGSPQLRTASVQKFAPPKFHPPLLASLAPAKPCPASQPTYTGAKSFTAPAHLVLCTL